MRRLFQNNYSPVTLHLSHATRILKENPAIMSTLNKIAVDILQFMEFVDIHCGIYTTWLYCGTSIYQRAKGMPKYVRYNKVSLHCMEVLFHIFNYYWGEEYSKNLRLRMWFLRTC